MSEDRSSNQETNKETECRHTNSANTTDHQEHHCLSPRLPKKTFKEDKEGQGLALKKEENPEEIETKISFEELRDLGDTLEMKAHTAFNEFSLPSMR